MTKKKDEKTLALDAVEKWAKDMQRPMMMLRAAVGATRAGIELPAGRTVEDELAAVLELVVEVPIWVLGKAGNEVAEGDVD